VPHVHELRLVLTTDQLDAALAVYRDALGLPELGAYQHDGGRVVILDAGRATLELNDRVAAAAIDDIEVGRRTAGDVRLALGVDDVDAATAAVTATGAELVAPPTPTPWRSRNSRIDAPGGVQLTLFQDLEGDAVSRHHAGSGTG
jgi:lactoylglutathione lyase